MLERFTRHVRESPLKEAPISGQPEPDRDGRLLREHYHRWLHQDEDADFPSAEESRLDSRKSVRLSQGLPSSLHIMKISFRASCAERGPPI
jgi:hypothetical protein